MAASFPNAKKTFSQVVNGITKLIASLFNSPYDEIEAIETYIGATGGGAQAYSESLKGLLISYRRGCLVDYKSAADIYVRSGEIAIPDASGNVRLRRNTSDLTVNWDNIDTGAEANSTTYYVYAVADASATTFTVKISTNATTPTGCTFYKKLGSFYNDASGNIITEGFTDDSIPKALGAWNVGAPWVKNTAYLAATDGFVVASAAASSGTLTIKTDSANPPTTVRASAYTTTSGPAPATVPVKKGDYWKVEATEVGATITIFWIPLGA